MHELDRILDLWQSAPGTPGVLATVVRVKGSAYRRPGARMLILADGRRAGSISGGCLEGDLCERASRLAQAGPVIHTYNTMPAEDAVFGFGMGCQGVVDVLVEPLDAAAETLRFLSDLRTSGAAAVLATVIRSNRREVPLGSRVLTSADGVLPRDLQICAAEVLRDRQTRVAQSNGCEILLERVGPTVRLAILGAGDDAIPLSTLARQLGWHVTVADVRAAYARVERFPAAQRVTVLSAHDAVEDLGLDASCAVVLMTHNYHNDRRLLSRLLPLRPAYLGLLGPRARAERLLAELGASEQLRHLHAPAGLDLGAESPEAIALAIVAEIHAAFAGRGGGMLKHRRGALHAPIEELQPAALAAS